VRVDRASSRGHHRWYQYGSPRSLGWAEGETRGRSTGDRRPGHRAARSARATRTGQLPGIAPTGDDSWCSGDHRAADCDYL